MALFKVVNGVSVQMSGLEETATQALWAAAPVGLVSSDSNKWTAVTSTTASTSASIIFTGLTSYNEYMFQIESLLATTGTTNIFNLDVSVDNGSNYVTTGNYSFPTSSGAAPAALYNGGTITLSGPTVTNTAGKEVIGAVILERSDAPSRYNFLKTQVSYKIAAGTIMSIGSGVYNTNANTINAVKFTLSGGTIASGTIRVYGR